MSQDEREQTDEKINLIHSRIARRPESLYQLNKRPSGGRRRQGTREVFVVRCMLYGLYGEIARPMASRVSKCASSAGPQTQATWDKWQTLDMCDIDELGLQVEAADVCRRWARWGGKPTARNRYISGRRGLAYSPSCLLRQRASFARGLGWHVSFSSSRGSLTRHNAGSTKHGILRSIRGIS